MIDPYLRESTLGEDNQQTGLATGTVTNNNEFPSDFRHAVKTTE